MPWILPPFFPLLIWRATPDAWRPLVAAAGVFILVMVVLLFARSVRRRNARDAATSAPKEEYRWLSGWDAALYGRHFGSFLRFRGWRILSSSPAGKDRLTVVAEKYRCRLALLCVEPGQDAAEADLGHLEAVGRDARATRVALVSRSAMAPTARPPEAGRNLWQIRYDDLRRLDDLLRVDD
jgi:hypothetical protein